MPATPPVDPADQPAEGQTVWLIRSEFYVSVKTIDRVFDDDDYGIDGRLYRREHFATTEAEAIEKIRQRRSESIAAHLRSIERLKEIEPATVLGEAARRAADRLD